MTSLYTSNIPKYFVYNALKGLGFGLFVALWVIYLQQRRGLSLTEATVVDVTFLITATLGEIPTGVVADVYGRRTSMLIGAALMGISMLLWPVVPFLPLIVLAYAGMALGYTFLSGAEDALFYESLKATGRADDYARFAGRVNATHVAAFAIGTAASGLLASIDMIVPFLVGGVCILSMFGVVLTFKEPHNHEHPTGQSRLSYRTVLRQSLAMLRERPGLRYPIFFLALVPLAAFFMETLFVQPQALKFGVPIAGIGFIVMAVQIINIAASTWSQPIATRVGERRVIYLAPLVIVFSLVALAAFQVLPALIFIAVIGFATALLRPLIMNRIHAEVTDDVRATILSMQSLTGTALMALSEPALGYIADKAGLPAAYGVLACGIGVLVLCLFAASRGIFPRHTRAVMTAS